MTLLRIPVPGKMRGEWVLAFLVALLAVIVIEAAFGVSRTMQRDLDRVPPWVGDSAWIPYQVGTEHSRLLLASEMGENAEALRLRGDIYLSFVDRLRQAPQLSHYAQKLSAPMAALESSARKTERLLSEADSIEGRKALREQIRHDAAFVREFTLALSKLYRQQFEMERVKRSEALRSYLNLLQILLAAFLGAVLVATLIALRLVQTAREKEKQTTTQASILNVVEEGILGISLEGNVLFFNPQLDNLLDHIIIPGLPLPSGTPGDRTLLSHVRMLTGDVGRPNSPRAPLTKTVRINAGNSLRHFILNVSYNSDARNGSGEDCACVITVRDVTIEAEAARQSTEYEALISEASRVMSYAVITGGIVHEISQPLSAIQNYVHVLRRSADSLLATDSHRMILQHLGEEAERASEIVRSVRLMGPQEARSGGSCSLSEAVERSVRLVSLGVNPPPAITIRTAEQDDVRVMGTLPLMGQLIINLLKNALQASACAGKSGAVIFLRRSGQFAEIAVADFGAGIKPEAAARLFEPFSRSSTGGMGLGLAICSRIANHLGGWISWENRSAGGALFKFNVPLAEEG